MIARIALFLFALSTTALSAPAALDKDTLLKNAQTAQVLNAQFQNMSRTDKCNGKSRSVFRPTQGLIAGCSSDGEFACIDTQRAVCTGSAWESTRCPGGRKCFALPSIRGPGTVSSSCSCHCAKTDHRFSSSGALPNLTLYRSSRGRAEGAEYFRRTSRTQPSHFRI